ncbi:MAG: ATP synthase F1 subunit epsilon [Planctomycetota bacterium]|nr:ATP synthase F1 subunit epsilon [Planctomycetota bacterium]
MADEKTIRFTVITPARAVFEEDVRGLVVPAFDGELGVLPGHAAFIGLLGSGPVRVTRPDGSHMSFAIRGGFLQVKSNAATVLTQEAVRPEEIDSAALDSEFGEARAAMARSDEEVEAKEQKLAWIAARQKVLAAREER